MKRLSDVITELERKVDVQNHPFGWVRFENRYFKNKYGIVATKNVKYFKVI